MVKSLIKEIIIMLLLLLAVILALGVLFYDYIPNNKTVPSVPTYKTADSVKQEIEQVVSEGETVLVTYEITSDDLKQLQTQKAYDPGKVNPFSTYVEPVEENTENGEGGSGSIGTNVNTANGGTSSGNTFYNNTGTK